MKRFILIILLIFAGFISAQSNDLFNRFRLAENYEQAGEIQKAKLIYEDVYSKQPQNFQFFDALNRVYILLKEYDNSIKIIKDRLKTSTGDINLRGLLGSTVFQKGDEEQAYKIWDDALKEMPANIMNFRIIANYAIERRAFNKAVDYLNAGKVISEDSYTISHELARLYVMLQKYKEAANEYCSILANQKSQINLIQSGIAAYINKPDALKATIEVVEEWADKDDDMTFNRLLAWLYTENNQYDLAREKYMSIDSKNSSGGSELYNFAQRAYQDGFYDEASKTFKIIIDKYPNSPFAPGSKIGFAKTIEASINKKNNDISWKPFYNNKDVVTNINGYKEVISAYEELIKNNKRTEIEYEASFHIGVIKLEKYFDYNGAAEMFNNIVQNYPLSQYSVPAYSKLAEIEIINNNLDAASEHLERIISYPRVRKEDQGFAQYMIAKIKFWQNDFVNSLSVLQTVVANLSDNYANDAIELSLIINTTKNDSANLALYAKAELLAYQNKFSEARELYSKLETNQALLSVRDIASLRNAEMMIAENKYPEAITMLSQIAEQKEKNIYSDEALFLLGNLYNYGLNDKVKAQESYEKLLASFPNSLYLDDAREKIISIKKTNNNL